MNRAKRQNKGAEDFLIEKERRKRGEKIVVFGEKSSRERSVHIRIGKEEY